MNSHRSLFSLCTCLPFLVALSCAPAFQEGSPYRDCLASKTIPESEIIDSSGILGTIESSLTGGWTPTKSDVYRAERIFKVNAAQKCRCIDSNYTGFYRRYFGRGSGSVILIKGTRKSRDRYFGGYRSFWIDVGEGECSGFDAFVNIRTGECAITVKNGE